MSILTTKATLEQYFITNWTSTNIQHEGMPFDYSGLDKWISLKYVHVNNDMVGFDGTLRGRRNYNGQLQVFCYAKQTPACYGLADDVIDFLSCKKIGVDINTKYGQVQSSALTLDSGYIELLVTFEINNYL